MIAYFQDGVGGGHMNVIICERSIIFSGNYTLSLQCYKLYFTITIKTP